MMRATSMGIAAAFALSACIQGADDTDRQAEALTVGPVAGYDCPFSKFIGLYDAAKGQSWNRNDVTVYDYQKCNRGGYLDGAYVADAIGAIAPYYAATTQNDRTDGYDGGYRVFAPQPAKSNGKLLIYLAGGDANNQESEQLLQRAAFHGYHVVAVRYWNDKDAEVSTCFKEPASLGGSQTYQVVYGPGDVNSCAIRLFRNVFHPTVYGYTPAHVGPFGTPCWPGSTVICTGTPHGNNLTEGDAALYRVRKLLIYLASRYPDDGWNDFKAGSSYDAQPYLQWDKVALIGHSNGSKVMFHVAHEGPEAFGAPATIDFDRVIFLSGPNLGVMRPGSEPPGILDSYVTTVGSTPLNKIYALSASGDDNVEEAKATWRYMRDAARTGLPGRPYQAEYTPWPLSTANSTCERLVAPSDLSARAMLYTGNCTDTRGGAHPSTHSDKSCTDPANPDTCFYENIWDYMLMNKK